MSFVVYKGTTLPYRRLVMKSCAVVTRRDALFFYLCKIVTTRASPLGIPRDIYRGRTQIRVKMSIA